MRLVSGIITGMMMGFTTVTLAGTALADSTPDAATSTLRFAQKAECPQVLHCGTKNGERKQYPTACAARDDGATNIKPKGSAPCETAVK